MSQDNQIILGVQQSRYVQIPLKQGQYQWVSGSLLIQCGENLPGVIDAIEQILRVKYPNLQWSGTGFSAKFCNFDGLEELAAAYLIQKLIERDFMLVNMSLNRIDVDSGYRFPHFIIGSKL